MAQSVDSVRNSFQLSDCAIKKSNSLFAGSKYQYTKFPKILVYSINISLKRIGGEIMGDLSREQPVPQVEIAKAEAMMTPVRRVMTKARYEIMSHESDFNSVGVTKELVEKAAEAAGNRAKSEFEAKEQQDPIRRLVEVLGESVQTADDQTLAQATETRLEDFRGRVATAINPVLSEAKMKGQPDLTIRAAVDKVYAEGKIKSGYMTFGKNWDKNPSQEVVSIAPTGRKNEAGQETYAQLSLGYMEKALKALGVLGEDDVLSEGMSNGQIPGHINGVTNIDGIFVNAQTNKDGYRLIFGFQPEAVGKIVELPRQ